MPETATTTRSSYDPASYEPLLFHTATEAFRAGTDSPRDYLERCLAVIKEREPVVRAWVVINEQGAREAADASTERWRRGEPLSPIDGMPLGIKDLLETKDMPTQFGCVAYEGNFPRRDNAAVWALRQAGAIILGKTVTTELGGAHPGPTTNPFNPAHTPGGSSSGSAAAVAAGMVPAAIATQVGGSLMRPASFCGLWGLKPTQGAINRGERQATSMSTHGLHAGCAQDMWLAAIAIASRAGGDRAQLAMTGPTDTTPAPTRPLTLAILQTEGWPELSDASRDAFEAVVEQVRAQGVTVLHRSGDSELERLEQLLDGALAIGGPITAWENHWAQRELIREHPDGVSERGKQTIAVAERLGRAGYEELLYKRALVRDAYALLAPRVDAFILPASAGPAPLWGGDVPGQPLVKMPTGNPVFNMPSSLLGAPAVTVPLVAVDGLPMGIQIMGQPATDARVTAIARWLGEAVSPVIR